MLEDKYKPIIAAKVNELGAKLSIENSQLKESFLQGDRFLISDELAQFDGFKTAVYGQSDRYGLPQISLNMETADEILELTCQISQGLFEERPALYLGRDFSNNPFSPLQGPKVNSNASMHVDEVLSVIGDQFEDVCARFFADNLGRAIIRTAYCDVSNKKRAEVLRRNGYSQRRGYFDTWDKVYEPQSPKLLES
jgi:hypothetical protein